MRPLAHVFLRQKSRRKEHPRRRLSLLWQHGLSQVTPHAFGKPLGLPTDDALQEMSPPIPRPT
jgi:hypothetical protein